MQKTGSTAKYMQENSARGMRDLALAGCSAALDFFHPVSSAMVPELNPLPSNSQRFRPGIWTF